jgi:deazaflavin-dependent oxidoreductase (nitroreductase family)
VSAPPGPVAKRLLRIPAALYRANLGWLLGHRFLLLAHRGRRTGTRYETVLEVLAWRAEEREAVVLSGFGEHASWYRNVMSGATAEVRIARTHFVAGARRLAPAEAAAVLADYERRNRLAAPVVRRVLTRLSGVRYDGSDAARDELVGVLPVVALRAER